MSNKHPNPIINQPRDFESEEIVGWFMIAFKDDPDHEYPFVVKKDGSILPEINNLNESSKLLFAKYLSDREFHHVNFIQNA